MLQKAIAIVADPVLKREMLESIKMLSGSLSQTKHGQKVLSKLQKAHPQIFAETSFMPQGNNFSNVNQHDSKANGAAGSKKKSGNRRGQRGRNGKNANGRDNMAGNNTYEPVNKSFKPARQ